eukprot:6771629-Prymnesium_polylepis.2
MAALPPGNAALAAVQELATLEIDIPYGNVKPKFRIIQTRWRKDVEALAADAQQGAFPHRSPPS